MAKKSSESVRKTSPDDVSLEDSFFLPVGWWKNLHKRNWHVYKGQWHTYKHMYTWSQQIHDMSDEAQNVDESELVLGQEFINWSTEEGLWVGSIQWGCSFGRRSTERKCLLLQKRRCVDEKVEASWCFWWWRVERGSHRLLYRKSSVNKYWMCHMNRHWVVIWV